MKKIVSLFFLSAIILLSGCATTTPPVQLTPGANNITVGLKTPPRKACQYLGPIVAQYGGGMLGHTLSTDEMRHRANILMRNDAYSQGANYVYVKREDAQIAGAFNYQHATAIVIYADAFNCKKLDWLAK